MLEFSAPEKGSVLAQVVAWINEERSADHDPEEAIGADTKLLEGGVLESMKLLKLVAYLEESYGIEIGVENMLPTNFATPAAIVEMVLGLVASR